VTPPLISETRKIVGKNPPKNVWWDKSVTLINYKKIEGI
jgi:hypothetical protein